MVGGGVSNSQNYANVINGQPLTKILEPNSLHEVNFFRI